MKTFILLLALVSAIHSLDPRYRTYGLLNNIVPQSDQKLPWRHGGNGYLEGSDIIVVGKLDGNDVGPYKNFKKTDASGTHTDNLKIFDEFHKLNSCSYSERNPSGSVQLVVVDSTNPNCKEKVLVDQFNEECDRQSDGNCKSIVQAILGWDTTRPGPPVFEIANEPNVFPYMSARTYAWYYAKWHDEIKKIDPNAIILNGGLFCFQGLPRFARKYLPYAGIDHNTEANSERDYFNEFIDFLKKIRPSTWSEYRPEILNLHFYPYIDHKADNDPFAGSYGYEGDVGRFPVLVLFRIEYLKSTINQCLKNIKSSEVWLTEVGNINPIPEDHANFLAKDILKELEKIPSITRWYWFKAYGTDTKLEALKEYDRAIQNWGRFLVQYSVHMQWLPVQHLMYNTMIYGLSIFIGFDIHPMLIKDALIVADKINTSGVPQGLAYESSASLSPAGIEYLNRASKTYEYGARPAPTGVEKTACYDWENKCYAKEKWGWTWLGALGQTCQYQYVSRPCRSGQHVPNFISQLLLY